MRIKAQAALVEVIVAALLLTGVGVYAAKELYSASSSAPYPVVTMQNAIFDIESITYAEVGPGKCIAQTDSLCIETALESINEHYLLSYSRIQTGNLTVAVGNGTRCAESDYYCFPLDSSNASTQVCEYLCSD